MTETAVLAPMARYVTIRGAAVALGMSEAAIRKRIERGVWLEKVHYRRSPDSRIWIDMKGIEKWVEAETA